MTIPLKAWVIDEAAREGVSKSAIFNRIHRGKYPNLPLRRINKRVVLVELDKMNDWAGLGPLNRLAMTALVAYVERKTRQARRELNSLSRCRDQYKPLRGYWEGQYVALVKLKRRFERRKRKVSFPV